MNKPETGNLHPPRAAARLTSALFALLFALGGGAVLTGCEDKGPAEEVGEKIDEAAKEAGDKIEDAVDEVEEETDGG
ncbi:MAG: hypothetical protein RQ741_06740 [Wenzhouxiangellaceae bacterium]|nr:hypothetical protein [Wenzhouxiangellaceae bacterium]